VADVITDLEGMRKLIGRRVRIMLDRKIEVAMLDGTLIEVTDARRVTVETDGKMESGGPALWMIDFGEPQ
jgi:hypothetical protein